MGTGGTFSMKILVVGATSAIAQETAKCFAKEGAEFFLVGRNPKKLEALQADLSIRGAKKVSVSTMDLCCLDAHPALIEQALMTLNGLDCVLIAHGTLSNQQRCEQSVSETLDELTTNFLSVISLTTIAANYFESKRNGCLAVISSVAGDRGRQSNYVYGAAKGGVTIFLQGLRNRLAKSGVTVVTIKPGFVDTPMTTHIQKNALFASPVIVGQRIFRAIQHKEDVLYVPWWWSPIMRIIRLIPERMFKKLSL